LKNRDLLADNYRKKINDFLFKMANKPLVINNSYYSNSRTSKSEKMFSVFKYQTERERIEQYLNSKNENIIKENNKSQPNILEKKEKKEKKRYVMSAAINSIPNKNIAKKIITQSEKNVTFKDNNKIDYNKIKINTKKNNSTIKQDKLKCNIKSFNIRLNKDNHKTYFHSAEQAIMCDILLGKKIFNIFKTGKTQKIKYSSSCLNFFPKKKPHTISNIRKNLIEEDFANDTNIKQIVNNNQNKVLFQNDLKSKKTSSNKNIFQTIYLNKSDALSYLKKLSLESKINETSLAFGDDNMKSKQNFEDYDGFYIEYDPIQKKNVVKNKNTKYNKEVVNNEKYIIYNNCIYDKKNLNDIKKFGKIILNKCHYLNNKYFDNEANVLKKGAGKLMFTQGLSVNEFMDKYVHNKKI
jgi:hypothetical protein